jgi:hypothetical protein
VFTEGDARFGYPLFFLLRVQKEGSAAVFCVYAAWVACFSDRLDNRQVPKMNKHGAPLAPGASRRRLFFAICVRLWGALCSLLMQMGGASKPKAKVSAQVIASSLAMINAV